MQTLEEKKRKRTAYHRKTSVQLVGGVLALAAFLSFTHPTELPLALLPLPFLLIFYISYVIFRWLVLKVTNATAGRAKFIAMIMGFFPTLTLLLSSLDQLSLIDIAVVSLLLIGGLFYLRYAEFLS